MVWLGPRGLRSRALSAPSGPHRWQVRVEQRGAAGPNLLLARKLATSLAWKHGRLALLDHLQELETSDKSRTVMEAFFLVLKFVTAETGRDCRGAVLEPECQLANYPVKPPTIPGVYEFSALRDEDEWLCCSCSTNYEPRSTSFTLLRCVRRPSKVCWMCASAPTAAIITTSHSSLDIWACRCRK